MQCCYNRCEGAEYENYFFFNQYLCFNSKCMPLISMNWFSFVDSQEVFTQGYPVENQDEFISMMDLEPTIDDDGMEIIGQYVGSLYTNEQ